MKSLGDDSLPIDVTRDERVDSNRMIQSTDSNIEDKIMARSIHYQEHSYTDGKYHVDNINITDKQQQAK